MKRFLCAGEGYALLRTSIVLLFFFMCLQAGHAGTTVPVTRGDRAVVDTLMTIQPLQIGDTIPEALWNLPLQVVNHPEGRETITLGEYRGRTILLDFLSTGCSGCIQALPKLAGLQRSFAPELLVIPISGQSRATVEAFIPRNQYAHEANLPFVTDDRILKGYFPHLYISHVVWISAKGVVRATTRTNQITTSSIREFQSGTPLDWPVKTENTPFFNAPLIELTGNIPTLPNNAKRPLYYSMITGYTEGMGPYRPTAQDSLMGVRRFSLRNRSILDLYLIAVGQLYKLPKDDIILEVDDPSAYDLLRADLSSQTPDQWYQRYAICYESVLPMDATRSQMEKGLLEDLNRFLQLDGRLETRGGRLRFILSKTNQVK